MDEVEFDVIVVGGGVAGCATVLSLIRSAPDARFVLVDNASPARFKIGESLPGEARRFLQYLSSSITERLEQATAQGVHTHCTGNASVWQSLDLQETFAITNPFGKGWHLNRAAFDDHFRTCVRSLCDSGATPSSKVINASFNKHII
ncbi:hypothetical protein RSOLAG1IB_07412 [Rhizoctonia solani AG-1 IB]|uniref:FAD dependent oxidoreductase domain-containing protein n=1 Tax=Thanatephorus cucumeris (strain AG1-IB / isolate 7/3/14) TaxID=1108050 RepID=A0A0B7FBJ0_THACB|nr:hypothetical protein RSOLAG1IB_07412 [Rhizoctonia solani AG-1 IB]